MYKAAFKRLSPKRENEPPPKASETYCLMLGQVSNDGYTLLQHNRYDYSPPDEDQDLDYVEIRKWLLHSALQASDARDQTIILTLLLNMEHSAFNKASHLLLRARALIKR